MHAMIPSMDDQTLLSALRQGDKEAFSEIYQRYARMLFVQAFRKTGSREVSEDMLQEIFSALWTGRESLDPDKSLKAYLHGMLRYKVIDYYRLSGMHKKHLETLIRQFDEPEASLVDVLQARDQELAIHRHIQSLSGSVRTIFLLSRYEGLSTLDISQKLQLSHQTVRNQISKALRILREKFPS
jgi:RNA polymerase sigma-70 factor (family 1)